MNYYGTLSWSPVLNSLLLPLVRLLLSSYFVAITYFGIVCVMQEVADCLEELANDRFGRKVLHYLLESRGKSQCHPSMLEILRSGDGNVSRSVGHFWSHCGTH